MSRAPGAKLITRVSHAPGVRLAGSYGRTSVLHQVGLNALVEQKVVAIPLVSVLLQERDVFHPNIVSRKTATRIGRAVGAVPAALVVEIPTQAGVPEAVTVRVGDDLIPRDAALGIAQILDVVIREKP